MEEDQMSFDFQEALFDDPNRIPIGEAVQNFFKLAQEVRETKQHKILTKNGRAFVAISPLSEVALVVEALKQSKHKQEGAGKMTNYHNGILTTIRTRSTK
jgi:hypothetical protein